MEIGAGDGVHDSNTRWLYEQDWDCRYIESDRAQYERLIQNVTPTKCLHAAVSLEPGHTFDDLLTRLCVPQTFTLLSLDIDGNDYWVWQSLQRFAPAIVCVEYNSNFLPQERRAIKYDPCFRWTGGAYYGASAGALIALAHDKGYTLVAVDPGLNLFFVKDSLRPATLTAVSTLSVGYVPMNVLPGDTRIMPEVTL